MGRAPPIGRSRMHSHNLKFSASTIAPMTGLDLLLINPGGRETVYQALGSDLTAIEPPLWCRLIAGYARDRGVSVAILDAEAEQLDPNAVAARVEIMGARLVVMVVFGHQPSASTQQMVGAGAACKAIKTRNPDQTILIVGGHVSALPEQTLREEAVDFACKGEGPVTVIQLLDCLNAGQSNWDTVEGLVWWDKGEVRVNPQAPLIRDLDADLHGNVWDLLPMDRYRAHNWHCFGDLDARMPYASIYTSLGCPFKCSFCCINAPFDTNRYRMRSPDAVVEEIMYLNGVFGIRNFKIIDEMFVLNERHVGDICDALIDLDLDLNIWAYARIDTIKADMLAKLRGAGIRWLGLGIESASRHVRDGVAKTIDGADIVNVVRAVQSADIHVVGNFIFGLPDDDLASMQQTLDLATELNCEFANFYSAMAYPGSPLHRTAIAMEWELPASWAGYAQHSYECLPLQTESLTAAEVLAFRDHAFDTYFANPRYLDMIAQRFGWETRGHIEAMARHTLRRALIEEPELAEA